MDSISTVRELSSREKSRPLARFEPGATWWEAWTLPLCYAAPFAPPPPPQLIMQNVTLAPRNDGTVIQWHFWTTVPLHYETTQSGTKVTLLHKSQAQQHHNTTTPLHRGTELQLSTKAMSIFRQAPRQWHQSEAYLSDFWVKRFRQIATAL